MESAFNVTELIVQANVDNISITHDRDNFRVTIRLSKKLQTGDTKYLEQSHPMIMLKSYQHLDLVNVFLRQALTKWTKEGN